MPHVVTEPCLDCKNTVCVSVCPVNCFHEDHRMLVIDPDECIHCGACVPECPDQGHLFAGQGAAEMEALHPTERAAGADDPAPDRAEEEAPPPAP